ncbi:MAG: thiol:disulfide interchange protein DsbA/DsbL [Pseudomonadales bacterium]|jgi:thiol:disulfide interchange protein DsbA
MIKAAKRWLLCLLVIPMVACAQSEAPYKAGEHYLELPKPVATSAPDKIEVVELFWYGCPHCYALEPLVERWKAEAPSDVEFVRMPAVLNKTWEIHARAYYAAQALGILEQSHEDLFEALHKHRKPLVTQESLAAFYTEYGVTEEDFNKAFKSFPVSGQISRVKKAQREYRTTGVPVVIVNGKYKVSGTMKAGASGLFDVVDYLIEQERKAK